jgi:hypothetical protein
LLKKYLKTTSIAKENEKKGGDRWGIKQDKKDDEKKKNKHTSRIFKEC